ncbi:MAG: hypothetical protein HY842_06715 [Bacteroidetes bacterium]|nr:hypothetical protein [Bacteroidota bacterium]
MSIQIAGRSFQPNPTTYPVWWAIINLGILLYGILFLKWSLEPVIFLFWMEIIFSIGAALVRAAFALEGQPFMATLLRRIFLVGAGAVLGVGFILLTVTFTIHAFHDASGLVGSNLQLQMFLLLLNYLAALVFHFFLNGRFRSASPIGELMSTFVYLLVLLCLIMVVTMHLLPKFPALNQSLWVGLAVVGIKFGVDLLFWKVKRVKPEILEVRGEE